MEKENNENQEKECCKKSGAKEGLIYGLIPHIGCIAFIIFSVLGVTTAASFFKPLLLNPYFFHILIGMSFVFATLSAIIYLKKYGMLSSEGVRKKSRYLTILYGTTIAVNMLLFFVVFPLTANITPTSITGNIISPVGSKVTLEISIPCSGHASLIKDELAKLDGIRSVTFRSPNLFDVAYDSDVVSESQILKLDIFNTYKAKIVSS